MADTIREKCLTALEDALKSMVEGEPVADPYTVQFSDVKRGPLGEADHRKRYMASVVDGEEQKSERFPVVDVTLRVTIEFQITVNRGDPRSSVLANTVLGEVQRKLAEDHTLGGVAIDCREVGNDIDLDSSEDRSVMGAVFLNVRYRHATNDPRKPV
jgi:hypothetical protein